MLDQVPDSGPAVMSIDNRKLPDFKVLQEIGTGIKFVDASASTSNMRLISEDPWWRDQQPVALLTTASYKLWYYFKLHCPMLRRQYFFLLQRTWGKEADDYMKRKRITGCKQDEDGVVWITREWVELYWHRKWFWDWGCYQFKLLCPFLTGEYCCLLQRSIDIQTVPWRRLGTGFSLLLLQYESTVLDYSVLTLGWPSFVW